MGDLLPFETSVTLQQNQPRSHKKAQKAQKKNKPYLACVTTTAA